MSTGQPPGRPAFIPTDAQRQQVMVLRGCGWPQPTIATFFGISERTLRNKFRKELETGRDTLGCRLSLGMAQKALNGNLSAMIFVLKTQYGWRENVGLQALGKDGQPVSFDKLDTASLEQLLTALTAGGTGGDNPGVVGSEEGEGPAALEA